MPGESVSGGGVGEAAGLYDDSAESWIGILAQEGRQDAYGRELLVCGFGRCGEILCTRDYAMYALRRARRAASRKRSADARLARKIAAGVRVRAIQDAALARASGAAS